MNAFGPPPENSQLFIEALQPDKEVITVKFIKVLVEPLKHVSTRHGRQKQYLAPTYPVLELDSLKNFCFLLACCGRKASYLFQFNWKAKNNLNQKIIRLIVKASVLSVLKGCFFTTLLFLLNAMVPFSANGAGVTIITHGFVEDDAYPLWVSAMADDIPNYFQACFPGLDSDCSIYMLTITNIDGIYYYYPPVRSNGTPPTATQSGEIIIELDWSSVSGDLSESYASTSNVAYAVSQVLMATNSFSELNGHPAIEFPIHLVGHSRGGSLMSQISYDLGTNGIWTDHLTTLDPYPLNNDGNFDPEFVEVDAPAEYTYSTVLFADNYWQDLGFGAPLDPDGEPVNGAYVRQLYNLSGGYNDTAIFGTYHSNVHLWYHGTIDLATPANDGIGGATITTFERDEWWFADEEEGANAGFEYSLIGGGNRMSTNQPLGFGYGAIVDGYNQWWDFGAGSSANRTLLPTNNGTWPNIIKFDVIGTNIVATGQTIATKFYFQYGGASNNVTAQFYFDADFNPYNTNSTPITEILLTNTGIDSVYYDSVNLATTNVPSGVYAIYAKISDGVHTRYLYAPEQVEIVALQQAPGMSLSGNLAFGNVTVGATEQRTLTISNGGNTTLTVSNISYPTGFSGNWSGTIAAGASQPVTVTFSPTSATVYGVLVTVNADNTVGVNMISISGIGVNGDSTLTIVIVTNGDGTVSPNLSGKVLNGGAKVSLKAVADSGNVFADWTGTTNSTNNPLNFAMDKSYTVQANFITNPFLSFVGTYNGLFTATDGNVTETNAGMLKGLTLTSKGTYSGSLLFNGASKSFSGTFDLALNATNSIKVGGETLGLGMSLTANDPVPQVTGTVSGNGWTSTNLTAYRAVTNSLLSSPFTLLILAGTNDVPNPGGSGYALISGTQGTARTPATAKITGALADGTAFSQSTSVSLDGYVPLYANLYSSKGLLLGSINLTNASRKTLYWVHPTVKSGLFTSAFISTNQILLSPWTNSASPGVSPTNLLEVETTDNASVTNNYAITLTSGALKPDESATSLNGTIAAKTGLLTVTFGSGKDKTTSHGVLLLNGTNGINGGGYFLTKTNAGAVILQP